MIRKALKEVNLQLNRRISMGQAHGRDQQVQRTGGKTHAKALGLDCTWCSRRQVELEHRREIVGQDLMSREKRL